MKKTFLFLAALFLVSCSSKMTDKERIRQMAVENDCISFLSNAVRGYYLAYYSLPKDFESLLSYLERFKALDTDFKYFEEMNDMSLDQLLSLKIGFVYYTDSLFLYTETPYNKIGCCIYGHPFYWLAHPEKYNYLDYYDLFEPSAYRINGDYLFWVEFDYWTLSAQVDSVYSHYPDIVSYDGYFFNGLTETPQKRKVPYISIVSYNPSSDSLEILTPILPADSLYVFNKADNTFMPIDKPLKDLCKDCLNDILAVLKETAEDNKEVARIMMGIRWYCNDSDTHQ